MIPKKKISISYYNIKFGCMKLGENNQYLNINAPLTGH